MFELGERGRESDGPWWWAQYTVVRNGWICRYCGSERGPRKQDWCTCEKGQASRTEDYFTLEELAAAITGGNLRAMARLLNDADSKRPLDENEPSGEESVRYAQVVGLIGMRANTRDGRAAIDFLRGER